MLASVVAPKTESEVKLNTLRAYNLVQPEMEGAASLDPGAGTQLSSPISVDYDYDRSELNHANGAPPTPTRGWNTPRAWRRFQGGAAAIMKDRWWTKARPVWDQSGCAGTSDQAGAPVTTATTPC